MSEFETARLVKEASLLLDKIELAVQYIAASERAKQKTKKAA